MCEYTRLWRDAFHDLNDHTSTQKDPGDNARVFCYRLSARSSLTQIGYRGSRECLYFLVFPFVGQAPAECQQLLAAEERHQAAAQ